MTRLRKNHCAIKDFCLNPSQDDSSDLKIFSYCQRKRANQHRHMFRLHCSVRTFTSSRKITHLQDPLSNSHALCFEPARPIELCYTNSPGHLFSTMEPAEEGSFNYVQLANTQAPGVMLERLQILSNDRSVHQ